MSSALVIKAKLKKQQKRSRNAAAEELMPTWDDEEEETGSKGRKLFKVSGNTESFLRSAFTAQQHSINEGKCFDLAQCKGLLWPLEWPPGHTTAKGLYIKDSSSFLCNTFIIC